MSHLDIPEFLILGLLFAGAMWAVVWRVAAPREPALPTIRRS